MNRNVFWLVLLGILAIGLTVGPDLWAAPGQSPARQTVPTKTPPSPPTEPPPTHIPVSPPVEIHARGPSEPLLPEAGGWNVRFLLGVTLAVIGLLVLVVVRRRV